MSDLRVNMSEADVEGPDLIDQLNKANTHVKALLASGGATQSSNIPALGALTSAAPAALTSVQNATTAAVDLATSEALANALKANYNALQTDVVAIRTAQGLIQADVAVIRTKINAILTALTGTGKPISS